MSDSSFQTVHCFHGNKSRKDQTAVMVGGFGGGVVGVVGVFLFYNFFFFCFFQFWGSFLEVEVFSSKRIFW